MNLPKWNQFFLIISSNLKSDSSVLYIDKFTLTHERNVHNPTGAWLELAFFVFIRNPIQDYFIMRGQYSVNTIWRASHVGLKLFD